MNKIPILILTGPTAVGKTNLSIRLAQELNGEIISADSMQIYKYMDIGSAKIREEEMEGINHHMIDFIDPSKEFSVSEFKSLAENLIVDIYSRGKYPIVVGGTGLYLNSLIFDMDFANTSSDDSIRKRLEQKLETKGSLYIYRILEKLSYDSSKKIHQNNSKRVIRAIEVYLQGGQLNDFSTDLKYNQKFDSKIVILNKNREILYDRINLRVDIMMQSGLVDEVKKLHNMGFTKNMISMKGIGYKEILDFLDGNCSLESAIEKIKQGSRRYAKRQLTWFKKYKNALWINNDEVENIEEQINIIKQFIATTEEKC